AGRAVSGAAVANDLCMKNDVPGNQHREHDEDAPIAPITAGNDSATCDGCENKKKGNIDHRGEQYAPDCRACNGDTSEQPKREQCRKRIAVDRKPSGPVRNSCQKKTRDRSCDIAIDHLMDVPVEWRERSRQRQMAEILR